MATTGKIPFAGFKAGAIKFVTLFGFSTREEADPSPRLVYLEGSYTPIQSLTGSVLHVVLEGSYVPITSLEGSP